jgi:hypothetical protein
MKELLLLPADLTLGEIRRYELKHGFVHEVTGLETRPTSTFCNVGVHGPTNSRPTPNSTWGRTGFRKTSGVF